MRRITWIALPALVLACSANSGRDSGGESGGTGGNTPQSCVAPSCASCGSCFERCSCETGQTDSCVAACASSGSGGSVGGSAGIGASGGIGGGGSGAGGAGGSGAIGSGGDGAAASGGNGATGGSSGASGSGGFAPGAVQWLDYAEQHSQSNAGWSSYMTDVIRHLPLSYGSTYYDADKVTYVHETTHGINAHLRNNFNNTGKKANAFYVGNGKAAIVVEPKIWKTDANPYVPQSLRDFRYQTYFLGASDWNDTPLYLYDEWVSYSNGTEAAVNLVQEGKWNAGWRDVFGSLEFTVYAFAVAMAVADKDPTYFNGYPQFRELLKWNAERSMTLYQTARLMPEFEWDKMDSYLATFQTSADAASLRAFVKTTFGDAWAQKVMGI